MSGLLVCPSEKQKSPVSSHSSASQTSLTNLLSLTNSSALLDPHTALSALSLQHFLLHDCYFTTYRMPASLPHQTMWPNPQSIRCSSSLTTDSMAESLLAHGYLLLISLIQPHKIMWTLMFQAIVSKLHGSSLHAPFLIFNHLATFPLAELAVGSRSFSSGSR